MSERIAGELTSWLYLPARMIAVGAPCAFILFAPTDWVDFLLRCRNAPDTLNPWVGVVFLYVASFFAVHILGRMLWWCMWPVKKLKKKLTGDREGYY